MSSLAFGILVAVVARLGLRMDPVEPVGVENERVTNHFERGHQQDCSVYQVCVCLRC